MNNIKKMYTETDGAEQFAAAYFKYLSQLFSALDVGAIAQFIEDVEECRNNGNTIFIAGNGGSAATASHMANDFALGAYPGDGLKPFRAISISDNNAVMTAIANDDGYEHLFLQQLKIFFRPGDRLIVVSASGNSKNLVNACEWVKAHGGKTIALVGFDGGALRKMCDIVLHVETPKGEYGPVEDVHMVLNHLFISYLQHKCASVKVK